MTIPTLDAYLAAHVTDTRAGGFAAFEDMARRTLDEADPADPHEQIALRWAKLLTVAFVEGLNRESRLGVETPDILVGLARMLGYVAVSAVSSAAQDGAPVMPVAKLLTDEFNIGARIAANAIQVQQKGRRR